MNSIIALGKLQHHRETNHSELEKKELLSLNVDMLSSLKAKNCFFQLFKVEMKKLLKRRTG